MQPAPKRPRARNTRDEDGAHAVVPLLGAKIINAGVSVLQSAEVGPVVASINPDEILDPLNDAVERLSGILVWAIGSLFLQQIVLEVAAGPVFKWLAIARNRLREMRTGDVKPIPGEDVFTRI